MTMNAATIEIQTAPDDSAITRERRYARGAICGAIELNVGRNRNETYTVRWNVNRGKGWRRMPWISTHATEAAALEWAGDKWTVLVSWLESLVSTGGGEGTEPRDGASAAFSAQVSSMRR
jgi:hypothetical protein